MLKYLINGLIGVVLFFIEIPLGIGWLLGITCLSILAFVRERFYAELLSQSQFHTGRYVSYIAFVFVILWLPLGLAFFFPNVISAYSLAASYLLDRLVLFLKGSVKHAS